MIKLDKPIVNRAITYFLLELFDKDDSFICIILLSLDCQGFLAHRSDFNVCAGRARIYFNMSS